MKLSIIIPFNRYKIFLADCLESLTLSKFQDFETILVLDHVEEDIQDLISKYQESLRMTVLECEEQGTGAARNKGIQAAKGDYVYFLDSDDYVLEDTLSNLKITGDKEIYAGMNIPTWYKRENFLDSYSEETITKLCGDLKTKYKKYKKIFKNCNPAYYDALFYTVMRNKNYLEESATNLAIRRVLLEDCDIRFTTDRYYYDIMFLTKLCNQRPSVQFRDDAFYLKRSHNDPYNMPSLSQEVSDEKYEELKSSFDQMFAGSRNKAVQAAFSLQLCSYIGGPYAKELRKSQDDSFKNLYFTLLQSCLEQIDPSLFRVFTSYEKRNIEFMRKNSKKGIRFNVMLNLGKKAIVKTIKTHNPNGFYRVAYSTLFVKRPIKKNVILFEAFFAKNYSDSPKYIYEYIAKNYPGKYKFVWALNNDTELPYGGKKVKRFSLQYAYYLAVSKYLVFNGRQPLWYRKRKDQIFLETWHGTPLKKLVFDQEEVMSASPDYKMQVYKQRAQWDYLVSANSFSTEVLRSCFMYEKEMLDFGYPRNDILYAPDKEEIALNLKKELGIPLDKKTLLYAPTWRDDQAYKSGQYKFDLELDLKRLKEEFGDEYVILLRMHYFIADKIDVTGLEGFVYNLSDYNDIAEIYLISDICMTDYSSVFFDYANLKRPILFFTYDLEKYRDQLRGFYISIEDDVPGPILLTNDDVVDAIRNIDQITEEYADKYEIFYNRFCDYDDGNASKRIVEKVFGK